MLASQGQGASPMQYHSVSVVQIVSILQRAALKTPAKGKPT
jgi:hypothetical protein